MKVFSVYIALHPFTFLGQTSSSEVCWKQKNKKMKDANVMKGLTTVLDGNWADPLSIHPIVILPKSWQRTWVGFLHRIRRRSLSSFLTPAYSLGKYLLFFGFAWRRALRVNPAVRVATKGCSFWVLVAFKRIKVLCPGQTVVYRLPKKKTMDGFHYFIVLSCV